VNICTEVAGTWLRTREFDLFPHDIVDGNYNNQFEKRHNNGFIHTKYLQSTVLKVTEMVKKNLAIVDDLICTYSFCRDKLDIKHNIHQVKVS